MKVNKWFHKMPLKFLVGAAVVLSSLLCVTVAVNKKECRTIEENNTEKFKNIRKHGEDISIYVDFALSSAYPRFFVYDNENDSILSSSKCAHGYGGGSTTDMPKFSNVSGSGCSCLGAFKLLNIDKLHNFDIPCVRIKGLDKTNSNAFARGIVIHEAYFVADPISIGMPIPVSKYISQGCFAISTETFNLICDLMKKRKSIYLYALYDK